MTRPKITSPILAIFALKFVKKREQQLKLKFAFKFKSFVPAQELRTDKKPQGRKSRKGVLALRFMGDIFINLKAPSGASPTRILSFLDSRINLALR
mgnify:CR=1 FL=1